MSPATAEVKFTMEPHGFWMKRLIIGLYRLRLRRLAVALAKRFVYLNLYVGDRYVCRICFTDAAADDGT